MTDFFLRDGDMQKAEGAVFMDDIDMVYSKKEVGPYGPVLVVVAMRQGQHVCQQCGEGFEEHGKRELRPEEVKVGGPVPVLLHAGCVRKKRSFRSHHDLIRGMQARRFYAKAVNKVEKAKEEAPKNKVIGG